MAASTVEPRPVAPFALTRPRVREQLGRVIVLAFVLDAVVLSLAVPAAISLKFGWGNWHPAGIEWMTGIPLIDFGWVVPLWLGVLFVQDAYSRRQFARGGDEFKTILKGSVNAALLASVLAYLINYDMSRGFYLVTFIVGTLLLLGERYAVAQVVARARRNDQLMHRVVAVGGEDEVEALCSALAKKPELGYEVVGACMTRTG